jgi:hypothetical protein
MCWLLCGIDFPRKGHQSESDVDPPFWSKAIFLSFQILYSSNLHSSILAVKAVVAKLSIQLATLV